MPSAAVPARRIDNNLKTDILCWLIVNEQSTLLLIQHAMEDFIKDHLTQPVTSGRGVSSCSMGNDVQTTLSLGLDTRQRLSNLLSDVG